LDQNYRGGDYYKTGSGPFEGLALARGIGHFTYRTSDEFDVRFGRSDQDDELPLSGGRYAVESYLEYHGDKLVRRFDPNSYVVLSDAMNHHDVGRGRDGVKSALNEVRCAVTVIGIDSDRLFPLKLQEELVECIASAETLHVISSSVGHDGFLLEIDQIGKLIKTSLRR
jgi:homoserine O-acetyltransferase